MVLLADHVVALQAASAKASMWQCRQREFLERTIGTLRKKTVVEAEQHRADYVRIRQVTLRAYTNRHDISCQLRQSRALHSELHISHKCSWDTPLAAAELILKLMP